MSEYDADEEIAVRRLSARACGPDAASMTDEEVEAAECEAEEWARRVNQC